MLAHHACAHGFFGKGLDPFDQGIARVNIDTGVTIGKRLLRHCVPLGDMRRLEM
jgi:hypothetical protein